MRPGKVGYYPDDLGRGFYLRHVANLFEQVNFRSLT